MALAGIIEEGLGRLHPSAARRVCWETADYARRIQFFDNQRTQQELDWYPQTPLIQTIQEAVAWFHHGEHACVTSPKRALVSSS